MQTAVTTLTCVADIFSWEGLTSDELIGLLGLYVPYLVLGKTPPDVLGIVDLTNRCSFFHRPGYDSPASWRLTASW